MDPLVIIGLATSFAAISAWIVTNLHIRYAVNKISNRVITASAETRAAAIDTVKGMEERIDAKIAQIPDPADIEIPDIDYEAVGQVVSRHMEMAFRQVEAQQAKRTKAFMDTMGIDEKLEGMEEAAKEEALAMMGPQAGILMEILEMKLPKKASVVEKLVLQSAKAKAAELITGMQGGGAPAPTAAVETGGRGFGVR